MKNAVNFLLILLVCCLLPIACPAEDIAPLPCAASYLDPDVFSRYAAYARDEEKGVWRVHALSADALLDQMWDYASSNTVALSAFHLELEGHIATGILQPVFRFYYADGKKPINATAVSFLIDGVRHDLAAASTGTLTNGREAAEIISAPLNKESLGLIPALMEGKSITVRLLGEQIYTLELDDSPILRKSIQAASLDTLAADYSLLLSAGMDQYALWDLSAAVWENEYGFSPAYSAHEITGVLFQESVADPFGMLITGAEGKAARSAQDALIDHGFLGGTASNIFSADATAAVARAQQFYGLIPSGCMDQVLEAAMQQAPAAPDAEKAPAYQNLGESALISLDRYWFADGVSAQAGTDGRAVANSSHTLLIADGMIQNISKDTMHLFMQADARMIYGDGYAYDATLLCQQDNGSTLDTMLLPMEETRLIVYAEIPGALIDASADEWRIELRIGADTLEYSLK